MGTLAHRLLLDTRVYHSLNDVTLPSTEGTTQIDHVLVSRFGIFEQPFCILGKVGVIWYHKQRRLFWYCTKA